MSYTEQFSEVHQLLAAIEGIAAAEYNSGYVGLGGAHRAFVLLHYVEAAQAGDTVDLDIEQASDALGTGAAAIAGKTITQLSGATDEGAVVLIEIRTEELTPGNSFINAELTIAVGAAKVSVIIFTVVPRYVPVATTLFQEIVP